MFKEVEDSYIKRTRISEFKSHRFKGKMIEKSIEPDPKEKKKKKRNLTWKDWTSSGLSL